MLNSLIHRCTIKKINMALANRSRNRYPTIKTVHIHRARNHKYSKQKTWKKINQRYRLYPSIDPIIRRRIIASRNFVPVRYRFFGTMSRRKVAVWDSVRRPVFATRNRLTSVVNPLCPHRVSSSSSWIDDRWPNRPARCLLRAKKRENIEVCTLGTNPRTGPRTDSKRWLGDSEDRRFWFTTGSSPSPSASGPFHAGCTTPRKQRRVYPCPRTLDGVG